jgi:hypothetical protein
MNREIIPIDDWSSLHHAELVKDIECHIGQFTDLTDDDVYTSRRLIMISIRERMGHDAKSNLKVDATGIPILSEEEKIQMYVAKNNGQCESYARSRGRGFRNFCSNLDFIIKYLNAKVGK